MSASRIAGVLVGLSAFVACPCHVAITLPLAVALLGTSAAGVVLAANTAAVVLVSSLWFIIGLVIAWQLWSRPRGGDCLLRQNDGPRPTSKHSREPESARP